ncbi:sigma-54-dependent Fis family transcriptional regulator [Pseudaquabacterium rugosum]|uniref:Sigma-54-dependent Fis family transcriptional regulator n=1 Tax=Pseudaquabacterium rugosum TaxID=2984194 RepID=A0ABU9BAK0_9BURK
MNLPLVRPVPRSNLELRRARQQLLDHGEADAELLGPLLARSWQRSVGAGLSPAGRRSGGPHASAAQLARALERQYELMSHARPVLEFLAPHVQTTDSVLILADAQGMVLQALGEGGFLGRAERVALRPGATWQEQYRGTNAIGTALVEQQPVVIHGAEHFLDRNAFLTCSAAPIVDPAGRLIGVIDISGEQRGWQPGHLGHTLGLACAAAQMVEHRLFDTWHAGGLRLRLHLQAEGLGTLGEGLLALAEDGLLIGANSQALKLLGLGQQALGHARIEAVLGLPLEQLLRWASQPELARPCQRPDGQRLWLRMEAGSRVLPGLQVALGQTAAPAEPVAAATDGRATAPRPRTAVPIAPTDGPARRLHSADGLDDDGLDGVGGRAPQLSAANDALGRLDTGDATLRAAITRARRVLDKPIALLLQGESGVGKEWFARAVHDSGPRRKAPFVAVNCAALPETLIEAELFGYQPGAFTGARREGAPGRVREAHGGTLFLDEIGDMPLAMQARLLRVLQERAVVPLGGGKAVPVDFTLICATHRQLRQAITDGRFREDLYYRINGLSLQLPALREREDLVALLQRMLGEFEPQRGLSLSPSLQMAFERYRWPGNLRQLANALRTGCALLSDHESVIDWPHLPDDLAEDLAALRAPRPEADGPVSLEEAPHDLRLQQQATLRRVLETCNGNLSEAARRLGISRNTLYRKLRAMQAG